MYIREVVDLNQANDDFTNELFELEQMMSDLKIVCGK